VSDDNGSGQGPFRENAKDPDPPEPYSIPAVLSLPVVIAGWISPFVLSSLGGVAVYAAMSCLTVGGVLGLLGLIDTRPRPEHAGADDLPPPKRGRVLAKLGFAFLLGPIVLGCLFFGLLLLTCGGH